MSGVRTLQRILVCGLKSIAALQLWRKHDILLYHISVSDAWVYKHGRHDPDVYAENFSIIGDLRASGI